jgi:hypothetical protein
MLSPIEVAEDRNAPMTIEDHQGVSISDSVRGTVNRSRA